MKKTKISFTRLFTVLFTALFAFTLFSCSNHLSDNGETGSVSFVIDRSILKAAGEFNTNEPDISYFVEVTLQDTNGNDVKQNVSISADEYNKCMETDKKFETKFEKIRAGKRIFIIAKVYRLFGGDAALPEDDSLEPALIGKSETVMVKPGKNAITIYAYNYRYDFDFSIKISTKDLNEAQLAQLEQNLIISAVAADSTDAKRIAAAGTDKDKIYEVLYNRLDSEADLTATSGANFTFNPNSQTVTVTGKLYLPINLDQAATNGKDIILISSMYDIDPYSGNRKTKFFGQSATISPQKGITNTVNISAEKMEIIDTPVVMYSHSLITDDYYYYINDMPDDNASTTRFTFDKTGYFYVLNSKSGSNYDADYEIISSNFTSPVEIGHYELTPSIVVDLKTNLMYLYSFNGYSIKLYQYPQLLTEGSTANSKYWYLNCDQVDFEKEEESVTAQPTPNLCTIYDGKLYIVAEDRSSDNYGSFFYQIELGEPSEANVLISNGKHIDLPYGSVTDMAYIDDYLYMLVYDCTRLERQNDDDSYHYEVTISSDDSYLNSRGALVKYDVSKGIIDICGDTNTPLNLEGQKYYVYGSRYAYSNFYKEQNDAKENIITVPGSYFRDDYIPPAFYVPNSLNQFYGPRKIIAIKPKKLVIADDGIVFYSDGYGLCYKNTNNVVTVDLKDFALVSQTPTNVQFDEDYLYPILFEGPYSIKNGLLAGRYYYKNSTGWSYMDNPSATVFFGIPNGQY